jgi:hypothetical protein
LAATIVEGELELVAIIVDKRARGAAMKYLQIEALFESKV